MGRPEAQSGHLEIDEGSQRYHQQTEAPICLHQRDPGGD